MKILKRFFKFVFLLVLLALGYVAFTVFTGEEEVAIPYRTDVITRGNIADIITANGNIVPEEIVTVGAQASGKITKIHVALNDEVKEGQLLVEIDPSIVLGELKQSKASLETAQMSYELSLRDLARTKALVAKDYVARVDLERAQQAVVSAKNSYESAKTTVENDEVKLGFTKVTSPIDGVIIEQKIANGQTLTSNFQTPDLFVIAKDLRSMNISMNIPESDVGKIAVNQPINFTVDAYEDRVFDGVIKSISLKANNESGVVTYTAIVSLRNDDRALRPGMTANITITLSEVKDILRVPASALRFVPPKETKGSFSRLLRGASFSGRQAQEEYTGEQAIYLWQDGALRRVPVMIGKTDNLYIEVESPDIKEGDVVVTGFLATAD